MTKHLVSRKYAQPRRMGDVVVDAFGKNPKRLGRRAGAKCILRS